MSSVLKIGLVTYDFYPPIGGQGIEAYNLYKELRNREDVDVSVLSSSRCPIENHKSLPVIKKWGIGPFYFSAKVWLKIEEFIKECRIDLIQVYGGPGGVFLFRKPSVPLIYLANHSYAQQYMYLKRSYYKVFARLEKKGYKLADRIVAISSTTRDSLVEDYGIPKGYIEVIAPGIEKRKFRNLSLERIPLSILFVGRLCPRKGITYLLEAIHIVKNQIPGIKLYIAGEGNLRGKLEKMVEQSQLGSNVIFLGRISEEELVEWYNRVCKDFCFVAKR